MFADNDVNIDTNGGDVVIGATVYDDYINAKRNVNINVIDGDVLNFGVKKTLINAENDINITVQNGKIGESPTVINQDESEYKYRALNVNVGHEYKEVVKE